MYCFNVQNVTHAFYEITRAFDAFITRGDSAPIATIMDKSDSRNGPVAKFTVPVCVQYNRPQQRVLLCQSRDANPFFHVAESLWMLDGRNDLSSMKYFISTFGDFSDDGETLNGAYGYRWRHAHVRPPAQETGSEIGGYDQIEILIDHLKMNPNTRRAVLQMWDVRNDLLKIDTSKDVCCNLSALFQITGGVFDPTLHMTVFNRSNDAIWGLTGANAVHFSVLHEYVALAIGARVGIYYQITNDLHTYVNRFKGNEWLKNIGPIWYNPSEECTPLYHNKQEFDSEVKMIFENRLFEDVVQLRRHYKHMNTPFIKDTVFPMMECYGLWKQGHKVSALKVAESIRDTNWRVAVRLWIEKRLDSETTRNKQA